MRQLISQTHHVKHENCHLLHATQESSSSRMRVINRNWSATKQRPHPQSVAEISHHSVLSGQDSTMWDIVWVSPQGHRSVSVSRHFLLQAPQCPCSVRKRFSRYHCCRGRSKPGCRIVGSHTRWELTTWADFQLCLHRGVNARDPACIIKDPVVAIGNYRCIWVRARSCTLRNRLCAAEN